MVNREMVSSEPRKPGGARVGIASRSRTTTVIDHLLSRGPMTAQVNGATAAPTVPATATGQGRSEKNRAAPRYASVSPVLRCTAPSILEGHLTWLVARAEADVHLWPHRIFWQDQTRILIRALEERAEDDVIIRALEQPWTSAVIGDDDADLDRYASELSRATAGQSDRCPYAALASSAGQMRDEILDHRRPVSPPRRVT
jgi:hypothetical protein